MELPRPEVTVVDPRQPGVLVAVEEPPPPRLGRRGAALLAAAALVGATALVASDVARDRRLDRVVRLELGEPRSGWSGSHDPRTGTGTVQAAVRLVNDGPRDLLVTSAQIGGLRSSGDALLDARHGGATVRLQRTVRCPKDGSRPPPEREPQELEVRVETPAGPRRVSLAGSGLPIGSINDSVLTACAYPPLREAVDFTSTVLRLEGRTAVLQVDVVNDGRRPVQLLSLLPARGLQVVSVDGRQDRLPIDLTPRRGGSQGARRLEVRLVVSCSALLGADLLRPFEELSAIVESEDRSTMTSIERLAVDPQGLLRQLAGRTCASG